MKHRQRPQNLHLFDLVEWVMNNRMKEEPEDWERDCWEVTYAYKDGRPQINLNNSTRPGAAVMYQSWHQLEENPFSSKLHAGHLCGFKWCVNPLHIEPQDPSENCLEKGTRPGANAHAKIMKTKKRTPQVPRGLSFKEKAEWYLENRTFDDENGCKIWTGTVGHDGYGHLQIRTAKKQRKTVVAHRFIYCMLSDIPYGDTPEDPWNASKQINTADHTCKNKACVSPEHINLVPHSQNLANVYGTNALNDAQARIVIDAYIAQDGKWPYGSKVVFARKMAEKFNVHFEQIKRLVFLKTTKKYLLKEKGLL